jgi:hypothetical protein
VGRAIPPGRAIQPAREFAANKCKTMQVKPRKFAWISLDSFGGIWPFQRVTREKNKKSSGRLYSRVRLWAERLKSNFSAFSCLAFGRKTAKVRFRE